MTSRNPGRPGPAPLVLTPGEPAGIGPDLTIMLAGEPGLPRFLAIADPDLLSERALALNRPVNVVRVDPGALDTAAWKPGDLPVLPVELASPCRAGELDPANAVYVLKTLEVAASGCLSGQFGAMVTAPVHKGVINDGGVAFSGHTEFLAEQAGIEMPVMLLAAPQLKVALVTTHLPLAKVSEAINDTVLRQVIRVLNHDLATKFGVAKPRILVCGLNPHAGESGHLGREEIDVIEPALEALREEGIDLTGPLPADTAFTPPHLERHDAVLAMYHDQGLPVLKALGFGHAVNVTLGLPFIRTSVDHGTALDLAGTGKASATSLATALELAAEMASHRAGPVAAG